MNPFAAIGHALGGVTGACLCSVCGPSAFVVGRPSNEVFGPNFTDYDRVDAAIPDVCDGCARMLGGKPGSDPPPLRTASFAVVGGELRRLDIDAMAALLRGSEPVEAMGWAISRQKHASLRCGPCSPGLLRIGCDSGTIEWRPEVDRALLDAVATLRTAAMREHILGGAYPPHVLLALGDAWNAAESVVSRYRPSLHLDLACAVVRRPEITPESAPMTIPPEYEQAARLLDPLTRHSAARDKDPIRFWSELLPRRLDAASNSATVLEWTSYLVRALDVSSFHPDVVAVLSAPCDDAAVLSVLRRDHRLLIAFVRQIQADRSY